MDLKARATHPRPRGQKCSPILFYIIVGVVLASIILFVALRPPQNTPTRRAPATALDLR